MFVTIETARQVLQELEKQSENILGTELFGSTLRNGRGHDVDVVVQVDEKMSSEWWSDMRDLHVKWPSRLLFVRRFVKRYMPALDEFSIQAKKQRRQARASAIVGVDFSGLGSSFQTNLDVFLLPPGWRSGSSLNHELMFRVAPIADDRKTVTFLEAIAEEIEKFS